METHIANEFADEIQSEDDDALTNLQKVRMKEAQATCPRCKQGFCASHGTKLGAYKERAPWAAMTQLPDEEEGEGPEEEEPEVDDPNLSKAETVSRVCRNEGCGKLFTENENHSSACHYHRGPISFSNRSTEEHKVLHEFTLFINSDDKRLTIRGSHGFSENEKRMEFEKLWREKRIE